jgi:hypothetical protein
MIINLTTSKISTECHLLNIDQVERLHELLKKFTHLFDATLRNQNKDPVESEQKEKNDKHHHEKPFPVTNLRKAAER